MRDRAQQNATMTVGTISIAVEIREVAVDQVRYYKSNPRIFSILKQHGANVSQDVIERELWNLDSTKDLYRDIQRNGGLLEEVFVRGEEVLEGNSRLCAYRKLLSHAKESGDQTAIAKWSNIRAKILPSAVNDETVFAILGILHVRGKAEWRPYERGSYLYRQSVEFRKNPTELAEQIGCSETEVRNSIEAFKMMDEAEVRDPEKFSYFVEFQKNRKMKDAEQYLPPGRKLDELFVKLVRDDVIPRAERVRDLPLILNDKKARRGFLDGSLPFDDAVEAAKERHPETESSFYSKLKRATAALEAAEPQRVQEEVEADSGKKHILEQLCKTTIRFCGAVGIQVSAINRIQKRGKARR